MYTLFFIDNGSRETETELFEDIDKAMRFAVSHPSWELHDANGTRIAHGSRDDYKWQRQPDNCPPWW